MFAGIKRLFGVHNIFDNNEENFIGIKKRPDWEREDGTINKDKQEEALKEIKYPVILPDAGLDLLCLQAQYLVIVNYLSYITQFHRINTT